MPNVKGRNVVVEIAATYSTANTVTAMTNANPVVVTSSTHGNANNVVGYLTGGIPQMDGMAVRVKSTATDTFQCQGVDGTNFSAFAAPSTFVAVATWSNLTECNGYDIAGGASEKLDVTRLLDTVKQEEAGLLPAQTVSFNLIAQTSPSTAMALVQSAVMQQGYIVMRITHADGSVRVLRGQPSLPNESVAVGQVGTSAFDLTVKGLIFPLAA